LDNWRKNSAVTAAAQLYALVQALFFGHHAKGNAFVRLQAADQLVAGLQAFLRGEVDLLFDFFECKIVSIHVLLFGSGCLLYDEILAASAADFAMLFGCCITYKYKKGNRYGHSRSVSSAAVWHAYMSYLGLCRHCPIYDGGRN
jgi:hypothetical protein